MIYINDNLRISKLDEACLQLEVFRPVTSKKTGKTEEKWQWSGYFGDVKSAMVSAFKKQLFNSAENELDIKGIINQIDVAEKQILKSIELMANKQGSIFPTKRQMEKVDDREAESRFTEDTEV